MVAITPEQVKQLQMMPSAHLLRLGVTHLTLERWLRRLPISEATEKQAMTKLAARTAVDGINAKSRVAQNEVNIEAEEGLRNAKS